MQLSKSTLPGLPVWFLVFLFFWMYKILSSLDVFNLFSKRRGRLEMAIEEDKLSATDGGNRSSKANYRATDREKPKRWYQLITPQTFFFTINSLFLNRTKASLRLNYEPLFNEEESKSRALKWYKEYLKL